MLYRGGGHSLAILLAEYQKTHTATFKIQIFATDIDGKAITKARTGFYPPSIATDIEPNRLSRWFVPEQDGSGYRINKLIRDMVVFSEQNVVKDPPFSHLNMISCRNLLIYLGSELQKKLIPLFHFALNPGGFLLLGSSESTGEYGDLFDVLERKQKIYQRNPQYQDTRHLPVSKFITPLANVNRTFFSNTNSNSISITNTDAKKTITEQELLKELIHAAALVNSRGEILYLHGRTGMYLEPCPGNACTANIIKMAREGLQRPVSSAIYKCIKDWETVYYPNLQVKTNGGYTALDLTARPVMREIENETKLCLVILAPAAVSSLPMTGDATAARVKDYTLGNSELQIIIDELRQELVDKDEYIQSTNEMLESANEELWSSNEEMQSVNEELQSANEELETSKEELQSVNEELSTVNNELQLKVVDLSRAMNDLNNLLAGTDIGTIFVDQEFRLVRFTPFASQIINLISSDIGRPLAHIVSNIVNYNLLSSDMQTVFTTLTPIDKEIQTTNGDWFTMRILPYRTQENTIEGIVLNFININKIKEAQINLLQLESQVRQDQKLATIGQLSSGVAHEINNPLTGIINYAQLLMDRNPPEMDSFIKYANEILNEGNRIAVIVRNLLVFSRQEGTNMLEEDPNDIVTAILSLSENMLHIHDIDLLVQLAPKLPSVLCSAGQIQQILLNLITNALDAVVSRSNETLEAKQINVRTTAFEDSANRWVRFIVKDNGIGIDPALSEKIFEPFFSTKTKEYGTGLGLSISYGIAKTHHGRLSLNSVIGAGTEFYLDLPATY